MQRTQRPYQDDRDDIDTGWMCGKTMGASPERERKPKGRILRIESYQAPKIMIPWLSAQLCRGSDVTQKQAGRPSKVDSARMI